MDSWYVKGKKWAACLFSSGLLWKASGSPCREPLCPPHLENTVDSVSRSSENSEDQHLDLPGAESKERRLHLSVVVSEFVRA